MSEPTFTLPLRDLETLADAICELDACKPRRDTRLACLVSNAHAAIARTLGDQAHLVYAPDDEPEKVPA